MLMFFTVSDNRLASMEAIGKGNKTHAAEADIPKIDSEEYVLTKRLPRRLPKRPNDVYVSRKTDFRAQLARQGYHDVVTGFKGEAAGSILSVESNQNVESKTEKCGVQYSHHLSDFKAKLRQNPPRTPRGSLQRSPRLPSWIQGAYF